MLFRVTDASDGRERLLDPSYVRAATPYGRQGHTLLKFTDNSQMVVITWSPAQWSKVQEVYSHYDGLTGHPAARPWPLELSPDECTELPPMTYADLLAAQEAR